MREPALRLSLIGLFLSANVLSAAEYPEAPRPPVEITFQGSVGYGSVDGYMQTPNGGEPGTSSLRRPTLHELNIDDTVFYDARARVQWSHLGFFGGYQAIGLDGSGVLKEPLVSRGVSFAAGEEFHSDNHFDWFDAGAGWQFDLANHRLEIFPKIDFALLDFSYQLSAPPNSVSRSYTKGAVRLGLEGTYHLSRIISLKLDGAASVPISNTPQIATVAGTVQFDLLPRSRRLKPVVFAGVGMEWIDYEDNQSLPNHIKLDLGPFVTGGLSLSF